MLKVKDDNESVEIGCFPALWKLILVLVIVFNFDKILDVIGKFAQSCK